MILFRCRECGQSLRVTDRMAGGTVPCPSCGNNSEVPEESDPDVRLVYHAGSASEGAAMTVEEIRAFLVGGSLEPLDLSLEGDTWMPLADLFDESEGLDAAGPPDMEQDAVTLEDIVGQLQPITLSAGEAPDVSEPEPENGRLDAGSGKSARLRTGMALLCLLAAAAFAVYLILPDSPGPGIAGKPPASPGASNRPQNGRSSSGNVASTDLELMDIGNMGTKGDFRLTDGAILMKSSAGRKQKGTTLNPQFDTGSLVGLRTRGDFVFQARLKLLSWENVETGRAGLMVRPMMQGKAQMVGLMMTRSGQIVVRRRTKKGGDPEIVVKPSPVGIPCRLKICRTKQNFELYLSDTGTFRPQDSFATVTNEMAGTVWVGVWLTSGAGDREVVAEFDEISFRGKRVN